MLLVDEETTVDWAGQVHVLATISLGEQQLVLTEQLLRVAGFLTAFSGLNFTVYLVTDLTYRREFGDDVVRELNRRSRSARFTAPTQRSGARRYPVSNVIAFHVGPFHRGPRCLASRERRHASGRDVLQGPHHRPFAPRSSSLARLWPP